MGTLYKPLEGMDIDQSSRLEVKNNMIKAKLIIVLNGYIASRENPFTSMFRNSKLTRLKVELASKLKDGINEIITGVFFYRCS